MDYDSPVCLAPRAPLARHKSFSASVCLCVQSYWSLQLVWLSMRSWPSSLRRGSSSGMEAGLKGSGEMSLHS